VNQNRFLNNIVLIFGGTSGIGKATAQAFAAQGADIVLVGRREQLGLAVIDLIEKAGRRGLFVAGDISREEDVRQAIEKGVREFNRIDIAFNNAGIEGDLGPLHEATAENIDRVIDINVKGLLYAMKHECGLMSKTGGGCIINNASVAGHIGYANAVIYTASKHAVIGATRAAALELIKQNIRVNAVSPAGIETEMMYRFFPDQAQREQYALSHPIGRTGKPEEVAEAVLWLASSGSSFVVGHSLVIDGGYTAQ
jgi:NAD(P)-dependent dehydrogenase (short-subunit alcohol dehydrogenase family)